VSTKGLRDTEATGNNRWSEEADCTQEAINRLKTKRNWATQGQSGWHL